MTVSQTAADAERQPPAEPGWAELALSTGARLRDLVADSLSLLGLEFRRAGLSLAGIVVAALGAAFAVMAFWLLLQALLIVGLGRLGIDVLWLLLAFTLLNAALALLLLFSIGRMSRNLTFRATAQALRARSSDALAQTADRD